MFRPACKGRCTFVPLPGWTQRWRSKQKDGETSPTAITTTAPAAPQRYTLGRTGLMSVEEARRKCHEVVIGAGPNGIRENTDEVQVPLFRDFVAGEWKTARYDRYKSSTRRPTASALNGQLLPVFGAPALDRTTRTDVTKWFDEYSQSSPGGTNWTLALLQRILNQVLACGHVRSNPARRHQE